MVAFAYCFHTFTFGAPDGFNRRFGNRSFYLYPFLITADIVMNKTISKEKALETTGILALACLIAGITFQKEYLIYSAVGLLITGLFLKSISLMIAQIWLKFAESAGAFNTKVMLSLVFFLLLTPIAILYRLFYGDFMCLKRKNIRATSLWKEREVTFEPEQFKKPW
jgi:hypothetical protein